MSKNKKSTVESLFYNNKFLMVFSVVVAVLLWATVKINYSADTTKTIHSTSINFTQNDDFIAYYDKDDYDIKVLISGKSYNLNAISDSDIIIEASSPHIDEAGKVDVTLNAKVSDEKSSADVTVLKVSPSTIKVYFDKPRKDIFDVVPLLNNDMNTLVSGEFVVGQLSTSMSTVEVEGPESLINNLKEVNFEAMIEDADLPLKETKVIPANVSYTYKEESDVDSKFLVCTAVNDEENPPTVTVPVFVKVEVDTAVKFLEMPKVYGDAAPRYKVTPEKVTMLFSTKEEPKEVLTVGDIYFSDLSNKVNSFELPVKDDHKASFVDKTIEKFTVTVDMSDKSMITLNKNPAKRVFLGGNDNYNYNINYEKSELDAISIVGPWGKLQQITEADIQVDIDVSALDLTKNGDQVAEVSKISIEGFDDCWVYGKYKAYISVEPKE